MASLVIRALDVVVTLHVEDRARPAIEQALGPLLSSAGSESEHTAWVIEQDGETWWLRRGLSAPYWAATPEQLVGPLVHELNFLVARTSACVALHAGGVTVDGGAIVVSGPMESGKSTLTAGLVRRGCQYLSDEAVGIAPGSNEVLPYPKPMTLDLGSHRYFPELEPGARPYCAATGDSWQVPVDAVPSSPGVGPSASARVIICCRYAHGAAARLEPLTRAEAVMELASSTFRFRERARTSLDALTGLVADAECRRLITGELEPAVDAVLDLASSVRQ